MELKQKIYYEYENGNNVKILSKYYGKSISTIYKYISQIREIIEYPIIKQEIKKELIAGDINLYIHNLNYSKLCLLSKKIGCYGNTKKERIKRITSHLKNYSILGLYPEHLNKEIIKKAYKQQAKRVHPDLNKQLDKSGMEFIDLFKAYEIVLNQW